MSVTNPIHDRVTITTNLNIKAADLNSLYYTNLINRIKKNDSNKCHRCGYLMQVYGISKIVNQPTIINENLSDSSMNVAVDAVVKLCKPVIGDTIYAQVVITNDRVCKAKLGPIVVVINLFNVDLSKFKETLKEKKWIKVTLFQVIYHIKEKNINVYANIEDICSEEEENTIIPEYLKEIRLHLT